ncbi:GNAT family protein [Salisediminibacterium beveridgei]|uniref:N-acetyltransferase domain-containing protein n=1 Tax=Salisediminibacterium beveridgei TaxID=632773 RepID=A0A1D7QTU1_9BACI|nr:hypothetical protein [Salisediminibacterium beveridgei]AOM82430.1 hypothetical protein BBEV_1061 [Salisediminibacterium beveridgei]
MSRYYWDWLKNDQALEIAEWTYDSPLDRLDLQENDEALDHFLNPFNWRNRFAVFKDDVLLGYIDFQLESEASAFVYMQCSPDFIGQGEGKALAEAAQEIVEKHYALGELQAKVLSISPAGERLCEEMGGKRMQKDQGIFYSWTFNRF